MTPISELLTIPISRDEIVDRIVEHSRQAEWTGNWAIQYSPTTGQHDWCWIGRYPPIGTDPEREPRPGWKAVILPRINANKLTVDARKDRIEDAVWRASAEGTLDGWLEAGGPLAAGVKLKFIGSTARRLVRNEDNGRKVSYATVISRREAVDRIVEHSRQAEWTGNWAIQYSPTTGQHDWCWIGRYPPIGTDPEREPRPGWKAVILPRINANKLTVDARKDRIEDAVWRASAEGTLDGWLEAGGLQEPGVEFKFV